MAPEQRVASLNAQIKYTGTDIEAGVAVITPLFMLLSAAIVLGIANSMSAGVKFKQVFAILAYANLPIILKHGLAVVVMLLKNPDDFNLINPLAFNPAGSGPRQRVGNVFSCDSGRRWICSSSGHCC